MPTGTMPLDFGKLVEASLGNPEPKIVNSLPGLSKEVWEGMVSSVLRAAETKDLYVDQLDFLFSIKKYICE